MAFPAPVAFSPGSISCFFSPSINASPEQTFSAGFAINLSHGVTAAVRSGRGEGQCLLNGRPVLIAPVQDVIQRLAPEPVDLHLETPLPLGCGFGVSGACALAAAFAIAKHYGIEKSRAELGLIAHVAEVVHRTGIGDVASQLCGGFVFRTGNAGPLDAQRLALTPQPLYYRAFGEVSTSSVLASADAVGRIAAEGFRAIEWLKRNLTALTLEAVLRRSVDFALGAGLLTSPQVKRAIADVAQAGGAATMVMLGQSVISTLPVAPEALWVKCELDEEGTRWLP